MTNANSDQSPSMGDALALLLGDELRKYHAKFPDADYMDLSGYIVGFLKRPQTTHLITTYSIKEREKVAKAYGGCTKCYGKGYATVHSGVTGYDDFGGDGFKAAPRTHIKYCTCDRGKQLSTLKAEGGQNGKS